MTSAIGQRSIRLHAPLLLAGLPALVFLAAARGEEPEARALAFLVREVPLWSRENHCFSCHNNGDAAQALYAAVRAGEPVPAEALADTNRWLADPGRWDHNGGEGAFSDKRLARLQFAAALAAALAAGQVADRARLVRAAERLAGDQEPDGAFLLEGGDVLGSPATYGRTLATRVLRDTLRAADPVRFRDPIARAERWLRARRVESVLDAAAILPVVAELEAGDPTAAAQRDRCLALIRQAQAGDGGWGPYASAPPETFDTAVVALALASCLKHARPPAALEADLRTRIERGRAFLIAAQNPDGSWTETTRPSGGDSYAQRISTTGWATLALLATRDRLAPRRCDP
jgi:hypothetical protein